MEIQRLVQQIRNEQIRLPPFQRGYEWDKRRVVELLDSLYKLYPIGIITFWEQTDDEDQLVRFIVDGQQTPLDPLQPATPTRFRPHTGMPSPNHLKAFALIPQPRYSASPTGTNSPPNMP